MLNCFHKMANSNRMKNSIDSLLVDGTISTNRLEISEHIVQYVKSCSLKSSVGGHCWTTFLLTLLMRLGLLGLREFLWKGRCWR